MDFCTWKFLINLQKSEVEQLSGNIEPTHPEFAIISVFQVLSALDILQPPHLDFFQEMYPFLSCRQHGRNWFVFRRSPKTVILLRRPVFPGLCAASLCRVSFNVETRYPAWRLLRGNIANFKSIVPLEGNHTSNYDFAIFLLLILLYHEFVHFIVRKFGKFWISWVRSEQDNLLPNVGTECRNREYNIIYR